MRFASALTTKPNWTDAVAHLTGQVDAQANGAAHDVLFVFAHPHYSSRLDDLTRALARNLTAAHVVGCTGAGLIGLNREIEREPAIALLAAHLPGVTLKPFHVSAEEVEEATGPGYWHFQLEVDPQEDPAFVLMVDPFSIPAAAFVHQFGEAFPGAPVVGGLASGGQQPGEIQLILDEQLVNAGAVGLALAGNIRLRTVVSQGCKPIGEPFVITRAEKNLLYELGGQPPIAVLQGLLPTLAERDQHLAKTALFLGRVINEYQEDYRRGDFLIRNLLGHDPKSGAIAVGDHLRTGQTVQFQVRDGVTAAEDLRELLAHEREQLGANAVAGALLFSCLGRGEGMYGRADHDIRTLQESLGPMPAAGFFCNGEIGPVGDKVHVHGFTSVIGLFTPGKK